MGEYLRGRPKRASGETVTKPLPDGGIVAAKVVSKPDQRERVNDPLRGVEVIPLRSVAKIARVGVMKVVIAFAKTDEGDQPTIAAAVLRAVWL